MTFSSLIKKTAIAGAVVAAAALPAKADWGGLYIGVSAGWQSTDVDWNWGAVPAVPESISHDSGIFGAHAGIQHQWGQFVVGVEGSWSGTGLFGDGFDGGVCNVNPAFTCEARLQSLFTIGPRLGWAPNNQWLLFITGGYAAGRIQTQNVQIATGLIVERTAEYHDGWFIGGGAEWNLRGDWILGLEYQHVELDTKLHVPATFGGFGDRRDINGDTDIIRVRLSYKLSRPIAPLK